MDRVAGGGGRRSRRGSRGFGRSGPSAPVEGWTSATGSGMPTPAQDRDFDGGEQGRRGGRGSERPTSVEPSSGGAAAGRASAAGRQSQRGGTMVWRPRRPQSPAQSGSAEGDADAAVSATSPAVPAALDNEDILGEILLRLPPGPSSVPRAGAVCKRWRRLVADPGFLHRFREHHRKAPLLGVLSHNRGKIGFTPVLDPPERIPAAGRFSLRLPRGSRVYGCRHGRVLVVTGKPFSFLVWDPVTGDQCPVPLPSASGGNKYMIDGTVICASGDQGHVHGACHSSPFQVIFLGRCGDEIIVWVYSSETGTWGDAISIMWLSPFDPDDFACCNTLVGNSIYWLFNESSMTILEFDLDTQRLATLEVPPEVIDLDTSVRDECQFLLMPTEDGELGFLILEGFNARIWKRKAKSDGDTGWVLRNTIKLHLPLKRWAHGYPSEIIGFAEDCNVVFIATGGGVVFMVHLESAQFKKLPQKLGYRTCYPFTSFCAAGKKLQIVMSGTIFKLSMVFVSIYVAGCL
uniref:F-box domain-containing protein n=1 Tax=Setaria italica TaxID=4555 RepID=K3Z306_SETIT